VRRELKKDIFVLSVTQSEREIETASARGTPVMAGKHASYWDILRRQSILKKHKFSKKKPLFFNNIIDCKINKRKKENQPVFQNEK
jgi:hypothetical protein